MGIRGLYSLELICDRETCIGKKVKLSTTNSSITKRYEETVVSEDQRSAMTRARLNGWMVTSAGVVCPACAKRRKPDVSTTPSTAPRRPNGVRRI